LIGGVLIGDVSSQSRYKKIIMEKMERVDRETSILDKKIDLESIGVRKT
jgi:NAD(P)H-nitrite reductase large subunit